MDLYLVIEREVSEEYDADIFGVFTSKEKAEQIKEELEQNFRDHNENITIVVIEMALDEPTTDYEFYMNN